MPPAVSPLDRWGLDPAVVHLNHGSYGGCPREVLAAAGAIRARLEASPMRFLVVEWQAALDHARATLAAFLHAPADRLAFVPNATTGVATALASARLATGDEILTTDHGYRACRNQLDRLAAARGLTITTVAVPTPFEAGALVEATRRAITPRTRLALLDHITSPTALCLPLEPLVDVLAARGVPVLVDGAHAPGQLPLDLGAWFARGVAYYVGNCHKWLCGPKAAGFLAVHPDQAALPLVTSHGASAAYGPPNRLHAELDWSGTHDPTPYLAVPTAIDTIAREGGGWPAVIAHNHALVREMADRFVDAMPAGPRTPRAPDSAIGSMIALPITLPAGVTPLALEHALLVAGWEVPIVDFTTGPLVRLSAHLYNEADQATRLARELADRGVRLR